MIQQNTKIMIKYLAQQGDKKQSIADRTGVCRKTVYNILKESPPKERKKQSSILEPYKDYIKKRLEKYNLKAKKIFKEIQKQGYEGSYSTVKPFVREIKGQVMNKLTERYETLPGEQAQMDWGECGTIRVDGKNKKLYVFSFVLGYSRMMYAQFTTSMKQNVLLECIQNAFKELGIPKKLLMDNMKTAVDLHSPDGTVKWNSHFLDFAEHYVFLPIAAPPYWPRIKGKVESGVGYVKHSFLEGTQFSDLADLNAQLSHWLQSEANIRIHGTTRVKPVVRYQEEVEQMQRYSSFPAYPTQPKHMVTAAWDCHVSFGGVRYSIPPEVAGKPVELKQVEEQLVVIFKERIVASHAIAPKGSPAVTLVPHMLAARNMRKNQSKSQGSKCSYEQLDEIPIDADPGQYDELLGRAVS